jgi:hypothetical protein
VNFATVLHNEVAKCEVLLAVIGPNWLDARDDAGSRRLDDPHDFVRIEIGAALQRNIPVIPILLDGAKVPKANQLPKDLEELSMRNGLDVRHASFHKDIDRLVRGLKVQLAEADAGDRHNEEERRRQEAEDRRRLAEKRREDEERRRLEKVAKLAAKEEQRRKRLKQAPQQPVKPWLLPLIGGVSALFPTLLILGWISGGSVAGPRAEILYFCVFLPLITSLYGGVAGMLIRRFGILKAVAIPVIPYVLLVESVFAILPTAERGYAGTITTLFVLSSVMCTCLAFWLHSLWVRKRRMIESGVVPP